MHVHEHNEKELFDIPIAMKGLLVFNTDGISFLSPSISHTSTE